MTSVVLSRNGIPKDVIFNRVKGFSEVHRTYKTVLYSEYMNKLYHSFANRAFWGRDEFGNRWNVLTIATDIIKEFELQEQEPYYPDDPYHKHRGRESTIKVKGKTKTVMTEQFQQPQFPADLSNAAEVKYSQFTNKDQLAPATTESTISQIAIYRRKLQELKSSVSPKSVRQQKRLALQDIPKIDGGKRVKRDLNWYGEYTYREVRRTPINIRSGRLFGAFFPAEIANGRIYSGPDQMIASLGLAFRLKIKVPYADNCEKPVQQTTSKGGQKVIKEVTRVLIVDELNFTGRGFLECHEKAIRAARIVYDNLLADSTKREVRQSNDHKHPPAPRRRSD